MPSHLSRETIVLDAVIRTLWFKEKYVIHGASRTNNVLKRCNEVSDVGRIKSLELVHHLVKFLILKNFQRSFTILIEQMMCQKCITCIQGDCKDFGNRGTRNLTFYQNLDFFQSLLTHTFCNKLLMRAKANCNSWKGLKFVDNIIHPTWASIYTKRTCNIEHVNNCIDRRS